MDHRCAQALPQRHTHSHIVYVFRYTDNWRDVIKTYNSSGQMAFDCLTSFPVSFFELAVAEQCKSADVGEVLSYIYMCGCMHEYMYDDVACNYLSLLFQVYCHTVQNFAREHGYMYDDALSKCRSH